MRKKQYHLEEADSRLELRMAEECDVQIHSNSTSSRARQYFACRKSRRRLLGLHSTHFASSLCNSRLVCIAFERSKFPNSRDDCANTKGGPASLIAANCRSRLFDHEKVITRLCASSSLDWRRRIFSCLSQTRCKRRGPAALQCYCAIKFPGA